MKARISFLLIAFLAIGAMSLAIIGCGGDEEETPEPIVTTPPPADGGDDEVIAAGRDWDAEKQEVIALWEEFRTAYNDRRMTDAVKLWTNKSSDYLFVNISGNEPVQSEGPNVSKTLEFLTNGHHSTQNDNWNGSPMNEVWVRSKGGQLQASAHGPNALRAGESWAYFVKENTKWEINKAESIETRNLAIHTKILIHEDELGSGFFDDDKYKR